MKKREMFQTLFSNASVKIKRIISPKSFQSRIFVQNCDELVFLLKGSAEMEIGGKKVPLRKNQSLFIPKKTKHQILATSKSTETDWLAIYIK
ncbi:MAG: cupin domain-containing protein [Patescibacteria group bacterium]